MSRINLQGVTANIELSADAGITYTARLRDASGDVHFNPTTVNVQGQGWVIRDDASIVRLPWSWRRRPSMIRKDIP